MIQVLISTLSLVGGLYSPLASFPGPAQLFVTCSMESGYLFSREDDIVDKWPKNSDVWFNELEGQHLVCITVTTCCTHTQLSHHLSTPDVTHMRKDTSPSAFFVQPKMVRAWEQG